MTRQHDVLFALRQVFAWDGQSKLHYLLTDMALPSSTALGHHLDSLPQLDRIRIPAPLLKDWLLALKCLPSSIMSKGAAFGI